MSQTEMETRIAVLEKELDDLKAEINKKADKVEQNGKSAWWKDHVGIFPDDYAHEEAMRLGREWRDSQRDDSNEK